MKSSSASLAAKQIVQWDYRLLLCHTILYENMAIQYYMHLCVIVECPKENTLEVT